LLSDARLYIALLRIDREIADSARAHRCLCGGRLHAADYPRKSRGGAAPLPEGYDKRLSFCCASDGCRRRTTPPSVRFLGRKVYLGAVVVLVSAMRHGITAERAAKLRELLCISRQTLARWRVWWRELFPATPFWQIARGRLVPPPAIEELPRSLLDRFVAADPLDPLCHLLRFLGPVTTGSADHLWEAI
jgi:hypothetical protein